MPWDLLQLAFIVALIVSQVPALRNQWRDDRAGFMKTLRLLTYYFVFAGAGIGFVIWIAPAGGASQIEALGAAGFVLGWIGLGASFLIKTVPKYSSVPAWLLQPFGIVDAVALTVIGVSLVMLAFG